MRRERRKVWALAQILVLAIVTSLQSAAPASAENASFVVDGNVSEWANVTLQPSSSSQVVQWAVVKDSKTVYFYVQQRGGNQYGMPIDQTVMKLTYANGITDNRNEVRFVALDRTLKDKYYGTIANTSFEYTPSDTANCYDVEFSLPLSYFADEYFTLEYCGTEVASKDIQKVGDIEKPVATEAVYNGIKIDGSFQDWAAVAKTDVNNDVLEKAAMVFDGDQVYIYLKESSTSESNGSGWSGSHNNGKFTLLTDTGRNTTFTLQNGAIQGIEGAKVKFSNHQYEISIPASALKQYKKTISFGYYMADEMLIKDVANLKGEQSSDDKKFSGITYDGMYGDWDYYPHHLIQYATAGASDSQTDAEAALYTDDSVLYGHVKSYINRNGYEMGQFAIRFNEKEANTLPLGMMLVNKDGTLDKSPDLTSLAPGTYEFYLGDYRSGRNVEDVEALENGKYKEPIFGKAYLTIGSSFDEMEYTIDLKAAADYFGLNESDLKLIQAKYHRIGQEWVSIAGTSSGPLMGISLCGLSVLAVLGYRRKKTNQKVI